MPDHERPLRQGGLLACTSVGFPGCLEAYHGVGASTLETRRHECTKRYVDEFPGDDVACPRIGVEAAPITIVVESIVTPPRQGRGHT